MGVEVTVKPHITRLLRRNRFGASMLDLWREFKVLFAVFRDPAKSLPFNGQAARLRAVRDLLDLFEPDAVVETGTGLGATTSFFAGNLLPVYSIELKRIFLVAARFRLRSYRNVTLILGSSPEVLHRLAGQRLFQRPLAYLDAHWWESLPLQAEVRELLTGWGEVLILVDDFKVPLDAEYSFDTYAGVPVSVDVLELPSDVTVAFPAVPAKDETILRTPDNAPSGMRPIASAAHRRYDRDPDMVR